MSMFQSLAHSKQMEYSVNSTTNLRSTSELTQKPSLKTAWWPCQAEDKVAVAQTVYDNTHRQLSAAIN